MTANKANDLNAWEGRQKRGGRLRDDPDNLAVVTDPRPGPEAAAEQAEAINRLLGRLADPLLREVATLRLQGFDVTEIAIHLQCTPRTVERKLNRIRCQLAKGAVT